MTKSRRRTAIRLSIVMFLLLLVAPLAIIYSGIFDIAATRQHTPLVYWVAVTALDRSIRTHAAREAPEPPDLSDRAAVEAGLVLYDRHCLPCHGAPGVAPGSIALGMLPPPPNLVLWARERSARELYWTVSNGLKMTGMPAWEFRLTERERWAIVAFLKTMPSVAPRDYQAHRVRLIPASVAAEVQTRQNHEPGSATGGDASRGRAAIRQYACDTCHIIPGVTGAYALVGPSLGGIARRRYLAGVLLNTPDHMAEWLQNPQQIDPLSAMPDVGVTARDARDIAAYLYTLR